jgi:hypothetical protein
MHCPDEGVSRFEEISYLLKNKDVIAIQEFIKLAEDHQYSRPLEYGTPDHITEFFTKAAALLAVRNF